MRQRRFATTAFAVLLAAASIEAAGGRAGDTSVISEGCDTSGAPAGICAIPGAGGKQQNGTARRR